MLGASQRTGGPARGWWEGPGGDPALIPSACAAPAGWPRPALIGLPPSPGRGAGGGGALGESGRRASGAGLPGWRTRDCFCRGPSWGGGSSWAWGRRGADPACSPRSPPLCRRRAWVRRTRAGQVPSVSRRGLLCQAAYVCPPARAFCSTCARPSGKAGRAAGLGSGARSLSRARRPGPLQTDASPGRGDPEAALSPRPRVELSA